jgi:hypothetical protein
MKKLKKATYAIVFMVSFSFTFQCATSSVKSTKFQKQTPFMLKSVLFQEWYAGVKVGDKGINVFIPINDLGDGVTLKDIYFRSLSGKLVKENNKYIAVLKQQSYNYAPFSDSKQIVFPFKLRDNECVISYIENGQTKFCKIKTLNEIAATYYENEPTSFYTKSNSNGIATLDVEDDD